MFALKWRASAIAISSCCAEPVPLSLMPGPSSTESRCAPDMSMLFGSPQLLSASTLYDVRVSATACTKMCTVTFGFAR